VGDKSEPPIVAELGRPETPEEAATRKAENSKKRRASQTMLNLVLALLASLAVVFVLVLVVVRPNPLPADPIDFRSVAEQSQPGAGEPLVTPTVPVDWRANAAQLEVISGVQTWYIGFVVAESRFVALNQGIEANPTWRSNLLENARETGELAIAGLDWTLFDRRNADDPGNLEFAMATNVDGTDFVLYGTATDEEFELLASSIAEELE
jgi:hypothetical protein